MSRGLLLLLGLCALGPVRSSSPSVDCLVPVLKAAPFIFTGKVDDLPAPGVLSVRVKRAVRGTSVGRLLLKMPEDDSCSEGFYRPSVGDVKVFAASKSGHLLISPLPMKLATLDLVQAVLSDVAYKPRPPLVPEPCEVTECPPGATCHVDERGQPTCKCRETCPMNSGHVCGTDGSTYLNLCHLRRASCLNSTTIVVQYPGHCDPCAGVSCPGGEVCLVTEGRIARCSCPEQCPLDHAPVCASDGRTFTNECALRADACRTRRKLKVQYRGPCNQGLDPCRDMKCEFGAKCEVDEQGRAGCNCGPLCEEVMRPVCGSDGLTHQSACHLSRSACLNRTDLRVLYAGVCGAEGPCKQKMCPPNSKCVETGDTAKCECNGCPGDYDPVCGSDGVSYGNECKLQRQACTHNKPINVLYKGLCNGCENKKCEFYAVCQIDSGGEANCVCPSNCSEETNSEEVCGSDRKTYSNECELKQVSCRNKIPIRVSKRGHCDECPTDCSSAPTEQVCGSDLVTYPSQCELLKHSCETQDSGTRVEVLFYGSCQHRGAIHMYTTPLPGGPDPEEACRGVRCQFSATCELDPSGYPRCACRFSCPPGGQPVCGSDLVLYQSKCDMEAAACAKQIEIRIRPLDLCQGMEVKPCGGDSPLRDPTTGEDLDCGNGHNRQDCPSDYYCHQTPQFAKCCRKESGVYLKDCADSWFGCCPDGKTPAQGPDNEGCPSMCGCNKIGSYSDWCDKETGACECRPGVGGPKCDRCEPGYWGLPKISSGYKGCLPCGCSLFGSVREDCEQMTGRCICKTGVSGHKCDMCPISGQILTPAGCVQADVTTPVPTSCSQLICYFGAVCEERGGKASCVCTATCPNHDKQQVVCGSDGQTYGSECQLKLYACKYQKDIAVQSLGPCKVYFHKGEETIGGTEGPVRRWTSYSQYTLPDDIASPLSKSTRHLLTDKYHLPGRNRDVYVVEGHATSVGVELGSGLGQPCSYDTDCTIASSMCLRGLCSCKPGHDESQGRCVSEESPSFTGHSWMRLRKLKAYHKFNLELEFLSHNMDGILFYTQQHQDGTGDFISLALVNGHVVLNYNLGSGTVNVPSFGRVSLGTWHSVKVRRYQRDALLQVDNEQGVRGQSQGTLTGLDLDDHAYLGYVPTNFTKVFQNAGTNMGLVGCLRTPGLAPEESHMIGSSCLHNPCRGVVCYNHGSCLASVPKPTCACQPDFTGKHCEEKLNPCVYSICVGGTECTPTEGGGFDCVCTSREAPCALEELEPIEIGPEPLVLPRLEGVSRAFALSISFATLSTEGTLLYNGQGQHNKGDFISLKLSEGRLVFSFSLGGNPVSIVTKEKIEPGEWHTARLSRLDKEGFLRLDNGRIYRGISVGHHLELNLDHPLYIGAPPFDAEEWPVFNGALRTFTVNGHRLVLSGARPCTLAFCSPNATSSSLCDGCGLVEDEAVHFDGNTIIKYPKKNLKKKRHKRRGVMRIEVSIKSSGQDGALILGRAGKGLWGLIILDSSIRFVAYDVELASKVIVSDGRWHRISALKRRKSLSLRVDREGLLRASLPPGVRGTTKRYFIGGSPPGAEGLYPGFQGCIRGLRIDGRLVELEGRSCPIS
nr:agrin-like isoform X3 [Halyomorpha halys]